MNKLHAVLAVLKKYHFWIVCGIVLVTTVTCCWWATAGMSESFQLRRTKVEKEFSDLQNLGDVPNKNVIDEIRKRDAELKKNIYQAWEILYAEQKEKNAIPAELGEDLKNAFENLKPKEDLSRLNRDQYQRYIVDHFTVLLEMIDVLRPAVEDSGGSAIRRRGMGGTRPAGETRGWRWAAPWACSNNGWA